MHAYRTWWQLTITFNPETVPVPVQQAIALVLDRHALATAVPRGPRYTLEAVGPKYQSPAALASARELAAPWAGTSFLIFDSSPRCYRGNVLVFQLEQIGLHGRCTPFGDPFTPDIRFRASGYDYPGEPVDGVPYARLIDHVVTSSRVGCLTYVPYVGVDLAALCVG